MIGNKVCNIHGQRVTYSKKARLISQTRFGLVKGKGLDYVEGEIY